MRRIPRDGWNIDRKRVRDLRFPGAILQDHLQGRAIVGQCYKKLMPRVQIHAEGGKLDFTSDGIRGSRRVAVLVLTEEAARLNGFIIEKVELNGDTLNDFAARTIGVVVISPV